MKITILSQYYYPEIGAAATRWTEFSLLLAEMGHSVTVVCEIPNYPSGELYKGYKGKRIEKHPELDHTVIRTWVWINRRETFFKRIGFFVTFMVSSFLRSLKLPGPDLYIVSSPPLFVGVAGLLLSKLKKTPMIFDIRDIWPESAIELGELTSAPGKSIGYFLQKKIYQQSIAFLTAVPGFKDHLSQHRFSRDKIAIPLLNGVSDEIIKKGNDSELCQADTLNIIYAGNIGLAQNLETLISAMKKLGKSFQLKIIGDGVRKSELMKKVHKEGIMNIKFIPPIAKDSLILEYKTAHIGLVSLSNIPLFNNAIPSKTFEYMAFGLFVICLVKGELKELLKNINGGICIDPDNSELLCDTIRKLSFQEIQSRGITGKKYIQTYLRKQELIQSAMIDICHLIEKEKTKK